MGEMFGEEWIHILCMAESLRCSPETIVTLLIGYTPIQNIKLKKKRNTNNKVNKCLTINITALNIKKKLKESAWGEVT